MDVSLLSSLSAISLFTHSDQSPLSIDSLLVQLHRWAVLNEHTVGHRQEAPDARIRGGRGKEAGILQRVRVFTDQAVEDCRILRLKAVRSGVEASSLGGKGEVRLSRDPVCIAVLLREVWRGCVSLYELRLALRLAVAGEISYVFE